MRCRRIGIALLLGVVGCTSPLAGRWRNTTQVVGLAPSQLLVVLDADGTGRLEMPDDFYWDFRGFRWTHTGSELVLYGLKPADPSESIDADARLVVQIRFVDPDHLAASVPDGFMLEDMSFEREPAPAR